MTSCDLLENSYLCGISNNRQQPRPGGLLLWFAWKFVPLWYQQQRFVAIGILTTSCDLLENSYLCGISNNPFGTLQYLHRVEICLKIRTFVVSATTSSCSPLIALSLWFAWKFVPLWYQQQQMFRKVCINVVVICLKIRTFVVSATTYISSISFIMGCDLLENSYLCGISNNYIYYIKLSCFVVICLKIRTFVVSATTSNGTITNINSLWFAWKFVPLWYQQQRSRW